MPCVISKSCSSLFTTLPIKLSIRFLSLSVKALSLWYWLLTVSWYQLLLGGVKKVNIKKIGYSDKFLEPTIYWVKRWGKSKSQALFRSKNRTIFAKRRCALWEKTQEVEESMQKVWGWAWHSEISRTNQRYLSHAVFPTRRIACET